MRRLVPAFREGEMRFVLHWLINAAALFALTHVFKWVQVDSLGAVLIAALVLGLVNALVGPVVVLLALPVTPITHGRFNFVLNGLLLLAVGSSRKTA